MAKVSKRGGFSDRNKIKPENTEIQLKEFDKSCLLYTSDAADDA